jgi:hypothetical protein
MPQLIVTVAMFQHLYSGSIIYVPIVMHAIKQNMMPPPAPITVQQVLTRIVPVAITWWDAIGIQ